MPSVGMLVVVRGVQCRIVKVRQMGTIDVVFVDMSSDYTDSDTMSDLQSVVGLWKLGSFMVVSIFDNVPATSNEADDDAFRDEVNDALGDMGKLLVITYDDERFEEDNMGLVMWPVGTRLPKVGE